MEVIHGAAHAAFPMGDASRVGEARRHAATLATALGWDDTTAGRLALVVTELAGNLVRHARHGRLLLAARGGAVPEIEVLSLDEGPGIADTARALGDGFSTGGTPGTGLGAVRRLADDFDLHSEVPGGTVVVARVRRARARPPARAFRFGVAAVCAPGETVSGDGWALALDGPRAAVLMADGLGHGPQAAEAAQAAIAQFAKAPFMPLDETLTLAHAALRITRGAAAAYVIADAKAGTVRSAGAGNITTRMVSGTVNKTLLSQHGTLGVHMRKPEPVDAPWPDHALLVLHSDGVQTRWPAELLAPLLMRDPALGAAWLLRHHLRGRDDATVMLLQRS
ncbi:ATP-binding protein [Pseudorhodoferax sp. Leaf267]|uniref:ATP-binding protein n=1 Tax=Pseudorhodoferax sp. Leaf267 TaxID=1736316 RepID=UPI0006F8CC0A|nr:ATP-binding protein [Pseudorhodoferax sp. Leaf267]KQP21984.1 histidine kinase [Pseudorhodoferax sp. Leaf267]